MAAGVHAALGDTKKAEEVAMGATKSTVIVAAAAVGTLCGPGAPACSSALAVGSTAAWDGVDSAVSGQNRGWVKRVNDLATGQANIDEAFDTVADVALTAAGGALQGYAGR